MEPLQNRHCHRFKEDGDRRSGERWCRYTHNVLGSWWCCSYPVVRCQSPRSGQNCSSVIITLCIIVPYKYITCGSALPAPRYGGTLVLSPDAGEAITLGGCLSPQITGSSLLLVAARLALPSVPYHVPVAVCLLTRIHCCRYPRGISYV